ncbi:NifB/NifX family molybdenum-iron cluster-binding protein, partial [Clostridium sp.]
CTGKAKEKQAEKELQNKKYKFAVSSRSGINIDQHFGHASEFYIYSYNSGTIRFLEKRNVDKYCTGIVDCDEHEDKISKIVRTIEDCQGVLVLRIGVEPRKKLEAIGLKVIEMYDPINKGIIRAAAEMEKQQTTNCK